MKREMEGEREGDAERDSRKRGGLHVDWIEGREREGEEERMCLTNNEVDSGTLKPLPVVCK